MAKVSTPRFLKWNFNSRGLVSFCNKNFLATYKEVEKEIVWYCISASMCPVRSLTCLSSHHRQTWSWKQDVGTFYWYCFVLMINNKDPGCVLSFVLFFVLSPAIVPGCRGSPLSFVSHLPGVWRRPEDPRAVFFSHLTSRDFCSYCIFCTNISEIQRHHEYFRLQIFKGDLEISVYSWHRNWGLVTQALRFSILLAFKQECESEIHWKCRRNCAENSETVRGSLCQLNTTVATKQYPNLSCNCYHNSFGVCWDS